MKKISERAVELTPQPSYTMNVMSVISLMGLAAAIDEWQATVEARLAELGKPDPSCWVGPLVPLRFDEEKPPAVPIFDGGPSKYDPEPDCEDGL